MRSALIQRTGAIALIALLRVVCVTTRLERFHQAPILIPAISLSSFMPGVTIGQLHGHGGTRDISYTCTFEWLKQLDRPIV